MLDKEQLLKKSRDNLKLEIFKAVFWAIAAGAAFGCIMIKPGEGGELATRLICLMVSSGGVAVNAKEAVRAMMVICAVAKGIVRVREISKEHEEETKE